MPKKQNVKKPKAPRKRRAPARGKVGAKDKSVKQNVNVNVTSSGGGGSGGSSIPSAQPSYHPLMTASSQGQKLGEDIQIKRLTDLLSKTITQASKPAQNIVQKATESTEENPFIEVYGNKPSASSSEIRTQPLWEGDEFTTNYQINRKPSNLNNTLLENINTAKKDDDAKIVNEDPQVEEAENANVEHVIENEQVQEVSKPEKGIEYEEDVVDPINLMLQSKNVLGDTFNKNKIDSVIKNTFEYYKEIGNDEPLLFDELNNWHFKIINGSVVPWSSNKSRGPLVRYNNDVVETYYTKNPKDINTIENDTYLPYGKKPNAHQQNLLDEHLIEEEINKKAEEDKRLAKENLKKQKEEAKKAKAEAKQVKEEAKVSKGKKSKKQEDFDL